MKLTMDDLIEKCPDCAGKGKKPQENRTAGGRSFGTYALGNNMENCGRCLGQGRWGLTETGKVLKEFMDIIEKLKPSGRV